MSRRADDKDTSTSRFLSLVLRHAPETVGLTLDPNGWVQVDDLLAAVEAHGRPITREYLDHIVATNSKRRFAFDENGSRIRASQGHSVSVDLALTPTDPPDVLWHGTVARFLPAIRRDGLRPMKRQHVHLSKDRATAEVVGTRRGAPVILKVDAAGLHAAGHAFYLSANGVWLTDSVPPQFLGDLPTPDEQG